MTSKFLVLASALLLFVPLSRGQSYWWRPFDGNIPQDAIVGSQNFGDDEYIGRGPASDKGVYAGVITTGATNITVVTPYNRVYTLSNNLEILCGDNSGLTWTATNSSLFDGDPSKILQSGFFGNYTLYELLYLGRLQIDKMNSIVGNVFMSSFYYNNNGTMGVSPDFEVFYYKP